MITCPDITWQMSGPGSNASGSSMQETRVRGLQVFKEIQKQSYRNFAMRYSRTQSKINPWRITLIMKCTGFLSIIPCSAKANSLQSLSQEKKSSSFNLSSKLGPAAADLNTILSSLCQSHKRGFFPSSSILFPPLPSCLG